MGKDNKKKKGKKSDKKLYISDVISSKLSKDEIDSLVIKNRIRNLTIGF
jgi:hypothetical protein